MQLGNLRVAQNQLAEAQKAYQQALDQDPNSTDALGGVLNVDLMQKQPDRAIATAKITIGKYPKNAGFHIMLGPAPDGTEKRSGRGGTGIPASVDLDKKNSGGYGEAGDGTE